MKLDFLSKQKFRQEIKFSLETTNPHFFLSKINIKLQDFKQVYEERKVNSVYFDNEKYDLFTQAKEGAGNRTKLRLRWYGELFGENKNCIFESKIKIGGKGCKYGEKLDNFKFCSETNGRDIQRYLLQKNVSKENKSLLYVVRPSLLVVYRRQYYENNETNLRITIDRSLSFQRIRHYQNYIRPKIYNPNLVIIELKSENNDMKNLMTKLNLGLVRTQFSKYVYGLDSYRT